MPAMKPQDTRDPRYIAMLETQKQQEAHAEAVRQAELAAKRGASAFLAYGPGARQAQPTPTVSAKPTPVVVHNDEVAEVAARRLVAEGMKARDYIAERLNTHGIKTSSGDLKPSNPFKDKGLAHLFEVNVIAVPYTAKDGTKGMLLGKMTNFDSGIAVPTGSGGIHYQNVTPKRVTSEEKSTLRFHGIRLDANGRAIGVDPNFTAKGIAWTIDNPDAVINACLKSAGKRPTVEAKAGLDITPKAEKRPIPKPKGGPRDARYANQQQRQTSGMRM